MTGWDGVSPGTAREISLGDNFGAVVVNVNGARIEVGADGTAKVTSAPANDTAAKTTHEIGAIESTGEHKGEIYGGIYPADNKRSTSSVE